MPKKKNDEKKCGNYATPPLKFFAPGVARTYLKRKAYNSPRKNLIEKSLLYLGKVTSNNYHVVSSEKQLNDFRIKLLHAYQLKPRINTLLESLIFLNYESNPHHSTVVLVDASSTRQLNRTSVSLYYDFSYSASDK